MKYTGKYKKLADQFRADGCDEVLVERFTREEMELAEFEEKSGMTDLAAYREWQSWPKERRQLYLGKHNDDTTFFPGFQSASWLPIMVLTCRDLRPWWPPNAANYNTQSRTMCYLCLTPIERNPCLLSLFRCK